MDKNTPMPDIFKANRDRAAPLLAKLNADGIGHMIDGKTVPSISTATFETRSPVDGSVLATVARGNAQDIDRAGRRNHALEHAVHAVDLEDSTRARRRLHGGTQAGGVVAGDRRLAGADRQAGRCS